MGRHRLCCAVFICHSVVGVSEILMFQLAAPCLCHQTNNVKSRLSRINIYIINFININKNLGFKSY